MNIKKILNKKAQSTIEYVVILIIVMAVFIAIGNYFKRGLQGRWKAAVDDLGDQYDPRVANSSVRHALSSNTVTTIEATEVTPEPGREDGFYTSRRDVTNSVERKTGFEAVGGY